jgi:hypothetical protein
VARVGWRRRHPVGAASSGEDGTGAGGELGVAVPEDGGAGHTNMLKSITITLQYQTLSGTFLVFHLGINSLCSTLLLAI